MKTQYVFLVFTALLLNMQFVSAQLLPAQPRPQTKAENNVFTADFLTVIPITPADLVQELLGPAANISNLAYTGALTAIGKFNFTNTTTGLDSGVIITSGKPEYAIGPNSSSSLGFSCYTPGDSLLTVLANQQTFDASIIEFDIAVTTDTLAFQFVFGSEE